jgi:TRAP transporter TAXI family solute receptor
MDGVVSTGGDVESTWLARLFSQRHVRLTALAGVAFTLVVGGLVLGLGIRRARRLPTRIVTVATAQEGGAYSRIGRGLARILQGEIDARGLDATVVTEATQGSYENLVALARGQASLAFLQSDCCVEAKGETAEALREVRTIAPLYQEVLHVVVDRNRVFGHDVEALEGQRILLGHDLSGTRRAARRLLAHLRIRHEEVPVPADADPLEMFRRGEADAVFVFAGLPDENVARLLLECEAEEAGPRARLLPIGPLLDGFRVTCPHYARATIPAGTYGGRFPGAPVTTLGVTALLVTRRRANEWLVHEVTRALFEHHHELVREHPAAAQIDESRHRTALPVPYHRGALAYYERERPSFLLRYADILSFGVALTAGLASFLVGLNQWTQRRRQRRIDGHFTTIEGIGRKADEAAIAVLRDLRLELHELKRRILRELKEEKLVPSQRFHVLLSLLAEEARSIDDRIEEVELRGRAGPGPVEL